MGPILKTIDFCYCRVCLLSVLLWRYTTVYVNSTNPFFYFYPTLMTLFYLTNSLSTRGYLVSFTYYLHCLRWSFYPPTSVFLLRDLNDNTFAWRLYCSKFHIEIVFTFWFYPPIFPRTSIVPVLRLLDLTSCLMTMI